MRTNHTELLAYRMGYTRSAFSVLARIAGAGGRRFSGAVAALFSEAYCTSQPGIIRVVSDNLRLLGHPGGAAAARRVFRNFAETLADYFWLADKPPGKAFELAEIRGPLPALTSGAILATGHFGFFEFGALALSQHGMRVSVVTDAEPSPGLTGWRADYRRRWGAETIELGQDAFSSLRAAGALSDGRLTAMLVDRPLGERHLPVALPNGAIPFSMAPAILSWMTGCPIIPVTVRRTPAHRYLVQTGQPVIADRSLPRDEALAACTRAVASNLVEDFLCDPLQWYQFVPLQP